MIKHSLTTILIALFMFSCGNSNKNGDLTSTDDATQRDESEIVNVNDQQKPTLMIIPSDALLKRLSCLKEIDNQGITSYQRNYQKALIDDTDLKYAIAEIQKQFVSVGFPLEDLEQTLKSISNETAVDNVDNIQKDAKTMLLNTARPDIILELDYEAVIDSKSRNLNKSLTYTLKAIDSYSNKAVASIQNTNLGGSDNISVILKSEIEQNIGSLTEQINGHFADIVRNGREISLRLSVAKGITFNFSDVCSKNEDYTDMINNWLKNNAFGGTFKRDLATDVELRFKNVRIKTLDENGRQYTAYDFATDLKKAINEMCGVKCKNATQSLSDANLQIQGM
jgi:hypothetical protein